jgi:hypothetical protein
MPRPEIRNLKSKIRSLLVSGFRIQPSGFLIALALSLALACPASGSAQEPIRAPSREAGKASSEIAPPLVFGPTTFFCDPPAWPGAQPRPIPPGKQLKDLCPPGARAYLPGPSVPYVSRIPPPHGLDTADPHEAQPDPVKESP